ncbi:MAG: PKD domain-containing protein [Opitutaceae bacterium]|nr:PKD domain-containing protein [Opitutaceae bacterium]
MRTDSLAVMSPRPPHRLAGRILVVASAFTLGFAAAAKPPEPTRQPVRQVLDLDIGQTQQVQFANGAKATVRLVDIAVQRDTLSEAVRGARVKVEVNGIPVTLGCANYTLPVAVAGVQVDCSMVKAYNANTGTDTWALEKDARLRLWPGGSPWMEPGTFGYPLRQKWFATSTQMANEPTYVDGGDKPERKKIYYHNDLDFGGCEGLVDVVAATDGIAVSVAGQTLPGYEGTPARPRYDVVYLLDDRGWYYRYSHMQSIDSGIKLGQKVKRGQKVGVLGKEGASGGWTHLHFGIVSRQPSGRWGTEEAYAYAWEAYRNEYQPKVIAVARPHHFVRTGEKLTLDATKSWCEAGKIARYEWTFFDRTRASTPTVERTYARAGAYSEMLKVTDPRGNVAYDFAIVQVVDPAQLERLPPAIHPSYAPSIGTRANQDVTFKVRSFRTTHGNESWDFGDGSPRVTVKSDGNVKALAKDGYAVTTHRFAKPGTYIVTVERENEYGMKAIGHLAVEIAP